MERKGGETPTKQINMQLRYNAQNDRKYLEGGKRNEIHISSNPGSVSCGGIRRRRDGRRLSLSRQADLYQCHVMHATQSHAYTTTGTAPDPIGAQSPAGYDHLLKSEDVNELCLECHNEGDKKDVWGDAALNPEVRRSRQARSAPLPTRARMTAPFDEHSRS